jgi:nucleoside-diphosphate-sugar epimerase
MSDFRIVITGASGFIGSQLVERLSRLKCEVLAICRTKPNDKSTSPVSWLQADLSLPSTYEDRVRSFCPEVIIHLAWQDIPDFSFEKSVANHDQSLKFLSFVTGLESCKKVLVSGSCWEFDKSKGECLESDIGMPKDHFTWAKHSVRSWLEMECLQKRISLGWFRIFYVYGPRQRASSLIPSILTHLKNGELPSIKTSNNANDYIFVDDVVDAFANATNKEFPSGVYNLGTGISTSVLEVCRHAEQIVYGSDRLTRQLEEESQSSEPVVDFWAGLEMTQKQLGWKPKTSLVDGITQTWHYLSTL